MPASDHLPRFFASPSYADAWRGFGSALSALAFAAFAAGGISLTAAARRLRGELVARRSISAFVPVRIALAALLAGCGASAHDPLLSSDGGGSSSSPDDGGGAISRGNGDGGTVSGNDGSTSNTTQGTTLLYAHTDTTLYSFDPTNMTAKPKALGQFDCVGSAGQPPSMTDFGVTKDGKMFGVSKLAAYPLEVQSGGVVHCSDTWTLPTGSSFYGLTVAPENTLGANEVLLAANNGGELYRIDDKTGATTQVGTLGTDSSGQPWALSGDIVLLANNGSPIGFATVRTCPNGRCTTVDTLIELDVSQIKPGTQSALKSVRGEVRKGSWCTNPSSPATFGSMFGIAAFNDKVYGFSRKGDVVEINNNDGSGCGVALYSNMLFAGAGVTTTAPVTAPPPK